MLLIGPTFLSHTRRAEAPLRSASSAPWGSVTRSCACYGVTNLRVFGSVARGDDGYGSDVDLLGTLPPRMGLPIAPLADEWL